MDLRTGSLPLVIAFVAIAAACAWQYVDMRTHQREHQSQHERHGKALLDAADGVAAREGHGGRVTPAELQPALDETRATFGLEWLSIRSEDGTVIAEAGTRPDPLDARFVFEKRFVPRGPRPIGRGPRWADDASAANAADAKLVLALAVPRRELEARLADDRERAIVTSTAFAAAILLLVGVFSLRTRSIDLRVALAASQAKLEGLETLRRLGAGLAHETRNPLGVVRGFAERIARGQLPSEELQQTARAILEETDRTVARLDEFMLLSRPAELRRTRVTLRELFVELETLLRPDLESAGAELTYACSGASFDADRDQLRRLMMNLLLNAIHAVDPGGHVELTCQEGPALLRITVADDGRGVPHELRSTLFEPYVTGRPGGTGLGLSIARRIASDHGFTLRYEPRLPRGTRMILDIPRR